MYNYEILDNFLDYKSFLNIQNYFVSNNFPWYLNSIISKETIKENNLKINDQENFQFSHVLYQKNVLISPHFDIIKIILEKIQMSSLIKAKINLQIGKKKSEKKLFHTDFNFKCKTSIFYLNTNNGYTLFENGKKIYSLENRLLTMDSNILHTGVGCTDKSIRIVVNINYFK
jgi:hypothetical protein